MSKDPRCPECRCRNAVESPLLMHGERLKVWRCRSCGCHWSGKPSPPEPLDRLHGLLAVIHRDGGQHTGEVGLARSVEDAHQKVVAWLARDDADKAQDPEEHF